jgi:hypothetical protein
MIELSDEFDEGEHDEVEYRRMGTTALKVAAWRPRSTLC